MEFSERSKDAILRGLAFYGDEVSIYYKLRPNLKAENDNMVFECAANYNANYSVTHNIKDFLVADLSPYFIDIINPEQFFQEVLYD